MNATSENPVFPRAERAAWMAGAAGTLACVAGVILNANQFLHSYLWAYWFWLGVVIGCGQLLMLYHLVGGAWGFVIQRILEAALRTFPLMFLLVIPLLIGIPHIYSYADPAKVAADGALRHKTPYLNMPWVIVRLIAYFAVFWVISWLLNRWSARQDETRDYKYIRWRENLSGPGIILYSLAMTFASVDWFMALEPDFYSTMYPGFWLVGQVLTALAVAIITLRFVARYQPLNEIISPMDFHDLGNLLLTFVVLWAYVQLAQLIIVWSGNLPKEISWYLDRTRGNWSFIALFLALFHFFFPFFALLSRRSKLQSQRLAFLAGALIVVHLVDNYWNTEPAFHPGQFFVHWLDFAAPVAVGGIWVSLFLRQLKKRPIVPLHDPRLEEALEKA